MADRSRLLPSALAVPIPGSLDDAYALCKAATQRLPEPLTMPVVLLISERLECWTLFLMNIHVTRAQPNVSYGSGIGAETTSL